MKKLAIILLITSLILAGCIEKITLTPVKKEKSQEKVKTEQVKKEIESEKTKEEAPQEISEPIDIESASIKTFIPNGDYVYTVNTKGNYAYGGKIYVKGNGTRFQTIMDVKSPIIRVYEALGEELVLIYEAGESIPIEELATRDYLSVTPQSNRVLITGPLKIASTGENGEIVELKKGLKMNGKSFDGIYAKFWRRDSSGTYNFSSGYTLLEGLGFVRNFSETNGDITSEYTLKSYEAR